MPTEMIVDRKKELVVVMSSTFGKMADCAEKSEEKKLAEVEVPAAAVDEKKEINVKSEGKK